MASRVNTKFVVILSISMIAVLGVLAVAYVKIVGRSATSLASMGADKAASKNFKEASTFYSKAVNKDPTNAEYVRKWIETLEQYVPETRVSFEEAIRQYMG